MDVQRSPYIFIAVCIVAIFLATGVRSARLNENEGCPGVCRDAQGCYALCNDIGYPGGYCHGPEGRLMCCCYPKAYCPGVCQTGVTPNDDLKPDCNTLCISMGYPTGYCMGPQGLTCCCYP